MNNQCPNDHEKELVAFNVHSSCCCLRIAIDKSGAETIPNLGLPALWQAMVE